MLFDAPTRGIVAVFGDSAPQRPARANPPDPHAREADPMTWWPFGDEARIGDYVLVESLGQGGGGQVFRGWKINATGDRLICVVKFPLPQFVQDQEAVKRYLHEGRVGMSLGNHANIVKVTDVGMHQAMPFLVMEFVDGTSLHEILKAARLRRRRLSLHAIYHILASIASALHHAHYVAAVGRKPLNVVHRDVKPPNVLISRDGHVKLGDFGIAVLSAEGTASGGLRGTHRYMSPEHLTCTVRPEMDVYALGIIAWELLENRVYRAECQGEEHFRKIMDGDIPEMHAADTPEQLVSLILDCLHINPLQRPRASEFLMRLKRCPEFSRDPGYLEFELDEILGVDRPSGKTKAELAATPELVATFSYLTGKARDYGEGGKTPAAPDDAPESISDSEQTPVPDVDESAPTVARPAPEVVAPASASPSTSGEGRAPRSARGNEVSSTVVLGPPPQVRKTVEVRVGDRGDTITSSDDLERAPALPPSPARARTAWLALGSLALATVIAGSFIVASQLGSEGAATAEPQASAEAPPQPSNDAAPHLGRQAPVDDRHRPKVSIPAPVHEAEQPSAPAVAVGQPAPVEKAEPSTEVEHEAPASEAPEPEKPKPRPTVRVRVALDFIGEATLKIGSTRKRVRSGSDFKVIPGTQRVRWRTGDGPWQDLGRHRLEDGGTYFIRLGPDQSRLVDITKDGM